MAAPIPDESCLILIDKTYFELEPRNVPIVISYRGLQWYLGAKRKNTKPKANIVTSHYLQDFAPYTNRWLFLVPFYATNLLCCTKFLFCIKDCKRYCQRAKKPIGQMANWSNGQTVKLTNGQMPKISNDQMVK